MSGYLVNKSVLKILLMWSENPISTSLPIRSRAAELSAKHCLDRIEIKAPAVSRVQTPSNRKCILDRTC